MIQNYHPENKKLQAQVEKFKNSLDKSSVLVSDELSTDLKSIMPHTDQKHLSPFTKLFLEEQQKYIALPGTMVSGNQILLIISLKTTSSL